MKTMKGMKLFFALLAVVILTAAGPLKASGAEAGRAAGITAIFNLDKGFVILNLVDVKTRVAIKKARVEARVTTPDGKKLKVPLVGMEMNGDYVYMNATALDMKRSGEYRFDIAVAAGKKKADFSFKSAAR
ncbi:MAG: hypothetical protein HZB85_10885 [Deltaproteobacteria bacterium]|nr:hypothetical protein [Deltaproteobacteria bacterium]